MATRKKPVHHEEAPSTEAPVEQAAGGKTEELRVVQAPAEGTAATPNDAPTAPVVAEGHWSYSEPSQALRVRIQRALGRNKFYRGPANGTFDEKTRKAIQVSVEETGYSGSDDGDIIREPVIKAIELFAHRFGDYAGTLNQQIDEAVWAAYAVGLEKRAN